MPGRDFKIRPTVNGVGVLLKGDLEVNVKDYGAIGDKTADDSVSIRNAVAALPATGGRLVFPAGLYKMTAPTKSITAATWTGSKATFTAAAHGWVIGDSVNVSGSSNPLYNGYYNIVSKNTNDFTVQGPDADPGTFAGTATATGSGVSILNHPGLIVEGLAGRHFTGSTTASPNADGAVLVAGTPYMTLMNISSGASPPTSKHAGPIVRNIHFEDPIPVQKSLPTALRGANPTGITLVSGTTYDVTVGSGHGFVAGDVIYLSGVTPTGYDGVFTLPSQAGVDAADIRLPALGSNPGTVTIEGAVSYDTFPAAIAPTCIGLAISNVTRSVSEDCVFKGLYAGKVIDPAWSDSSWGETRHCTFTMCQRGLWFMGDQGGTTSGGAQSHQVIGGDWSVMSGASGIYADTPTTTLRIFGGKWDIGQNTNTSGTGAVGINIRRASWFAMFGPGIEMLQGIGIDIGAITGKASIGDIFGPQIQGNIQDGAYGGTGIRLNGVTNGTGAAKATVHGGSATHLTTVVSIGQYSRDCEVNGFRINACTTGIDVTSTAKNPTVIGCKDIDGSVTTLVNDPGKVAVKFNNIPYNGVGTLELPVGTNVAFSSAALALGATDGFPYIPTCAGTPNGVPTVFTGTVPMVYDTTTNRLYVYNGGWKDVSLS